MEQEVLLIVMHQKGWIWVAKDEKSMPRDRGFLFLYI